MSISCNASVRLLERVSHPPHGPPHTGGEQPPEAQMERSGAEAVGGRLWCSVRRGSGCEPQPSVPCRPIPGWRNGNLTMWRHVWALRCRGCYGLGIVCPRASTATPIFNRDHGFPNFLGCQGPTFGAGFFLLVSSSSNRWKYSLLVRSSCVRMPGETAPKCKVHAQKISWKY